MLQLQKHRFYLAVSCLMLTSFLFCSCQKEETSPPPRPKVRSQRSGKDQATVKKAEPKIDYNKAIAVLETEKGTIEIDLLYDIAPKTVENFAKKVKGRRYNEAKFYRVEPKLLIQAGAPVFQAEELPIESSDRKHVRGTVAMAKEPGASFPVPLIFTSA